MQGMFGQVFSGGPFVSHKDVGDFCPCSVTGTLFTWSRTRLITYSLPGLSNSMHLIYPIPHNQLSRSSLSTEHCVTDHCTDVD